MSTEKLPAFPARPVDGHKGTFGKVLAIGGSQGMSGSITLSALSALRGGAGLVQAAVPEAIQAIVSGVEPSYMTAAIPSDEAGRIASIPPHARIAELCQSATAVAIGPGLGRSQQLDALVGWLYTTLAKPLVVDADALNALAAMHGRADSPPPKPAGPRVLTPHPGEFSRLTGQSTEAISQRREDLALAFAAWWGVVLVLKGHRTLITDGKRLAINTTGNPGMATGGAGDVLTGLITSLLAQGMPAFDAAQLGVHLHGLAGDLAAEALGMPGLIASDLVRHLPYAIKSVVK